MPIDLVCQRCGQPFSVPPSQVRRGNRRFCSRACKAAAMTVDVADRFWSKVEKSDDGCWLWMGHRGHFGYGRISYGATHTNRGAYRYAHRVAWELTNGPIPNDTEVLHRCDNPPCVRPDHLFLGTQADNNADRQAKGRGHRGEQTGGAKLTAEKVRAIRAVHAAGGVSSLAISKLYGVSHSTIDDVVNGVTWTHVR